MPEIRAVFFDIGNTVIKCDLEQIFVGFARIARIPSEDVVGIWASGDRLQYGLSDSYERGLISCEEFKRWWKEELIAKARAAGQDAGARASRGAKKKFSERLKQ